MICTGYTQYLRQEISLTWPARTPADLLLSKKVVENLDVRVHCYIQIKIEPVMEKKLANPERLRIFRFRVQHFLKDSFLSTSFNLLTQLTSHTQSNSLLLCDYSPLRKKRRMLELQNRIALHCIIFAD